MMFSPEFQILLLSLRLDDQSGSVREANKIIEGNHIDWDELYRSSDIHSIKPQLAKLSGEISPSLVPGSFKEKINDAYHQNLVDQLRYTDEFFRIRYMLEKAGIQIIPFKGFWLAQDAYGNMADREGLDVDVFARLSDLGRIKELMEAAGYTVEAAFQPFTIEEVSRKSQEYNFNRIVDGVSSFHIEFHWGICPPQYGLNISLEELQTQTVTGNIQGNELVLFTPSAHFLLVILHHGGKDRFTRLKQVLDVARLIAIHDDIDWEWVISTARRFNAEKLVYTGIRLAKMLTDVKLPPEVKVQASDPGTVRLARNRVRALRIATGRMNPTVFNFDNWLFRMRSRTGLKTRLRVTMATIGAVFFTKSAVAE
jgi:hypothetical protein